MASATHREQRVIDGLNEYRGRYETAERMLNEYSDKLKAAEARVAELEQKLRQSNTRLAQAENWLEERAARLQQATEALRELLGAVAGVRHYHEMRVYFPSHKRQAWRYLDKAVESALAALAGEDEHG